jgi:outer membrane protein assembly factor BamB
MRWLVVALIGGALGCTSSADSPPPPSATSNPTLLPDLGTRNKGIDWPQFLGPLGTGVSPEKGVFSLWPAAGLRVVWQKAIGTGYGPPVVSRGRLYVFDRKGDRARLRCHHSETGESIWTFEYPTSYEDYYGYNNGPRSGPMVDGERVYIYGAEGMLHCVRAADGTLVWRVDTRKRFGVVQNFFGVGSAPVIEGDLVIVPVGGSPPASGEFPSLDQKGNGSGVVAFDKHTGQVRYQVTDELASYASPVLATIQHRRWCFVFARGGLIGMDPATGKLAFHFPWRARVLESVNASNPVVVDDLVFISEAYGPGSALLKVRPGGFEVLWSDADSREHKRMQCHWNTPIYHDGFLYGCSGRHLENAELRCVELASGKVCWRQPDLTRASLLMVDGHFLCMGEDGMLRLLRVNPKRYEEVSRLEGEREGRPFFRYPCWAAPILAHGLLYIRDRDRLVCLELIPN